MIQKRRWRTKQQRYHVHPVYFFCKDKNFVLNTVWRTLPWQKQIFQLLSYVPSIINFMSFSIRIVTGRQTSTNQESTMWFLKVDRVNRWSAEQFKFHEVEYWIAVCNKRCIIQCNCRPSFKNLKLYSWKHKTVSSIETEFHLCKMVHIWYNWVKFVKH